MVTSSKIIPVIVTFVLFLAFPFAIHAAELRIDKSVDVSLKIGGGVNGEQTFILYGYTSPRSQVSLDGMGIHAKTYSADTGYYEFHERFSPIIAREVCLYSQDPLGRVSPNTCIPPFPVDYNVRIGPIILAPTISLNDNNYFVGDEVILTGQTIPNTEISLSYFGDDANPQLSSKIARSFTLVKSVEAFTIPVLQTKSDENGNYTFSLPSSIAYAYRIFVQTKYQNDISPKSITLHFDIFPIWIIILQWILFLFAWLQKNWLTVMISLEILIIITYIYELIRKPRGKHRDTFVYFSKNKYPLALRDHFDILPFANDEQIEVYDPILPDKYDSKKNDIVRHS